MRALIVESSMRMLRNEMYVQKLMKMWSFSNDYSICMFVNGTYVQKLRNMPYFLVDSIICSHMNVA